MDPKHRIDHPIEQGSVLGDQCAMPNQEIRQGLVRRAQGPFQKGVEDAGGRQTRPRSQDGEDPILLGQSARQVAISPTLTCDPTIRRDGRPGKLGPLGESVFSPVSKPIRRIGAIIRDPGIIQNHGQVENP